MVRHLQIAVLVFLSLGWASPLSADWRDDVGYTRLQAIAAGDLPGAPGQGFTQAEALDGGNFIPNTASSQFTGKAFTLKSGSSGVSGHANWVATYFYGNTTSLVTGNCPVDLYDASGWLGSDFLRPDASSYPIAESRAVQNHSWISDGEPPSEATEANRRLDYAINRDGFVCVVGANNGNSTILPQLFEQSFHAISVGLTNGNHSAGFTTLDTVGRIKPDIVAPESYTSFSTPMVASAAGLLHSKLAVTQPLLTNAEKSPVIKSLLMATATKKSGWAWANTTTRPLDLRYGAGELNMLNAYNALSAGRAVASNSVSQLPRGWSAEILEENSEKAYFFTIPSGAPSTPFRATLTWHRDVTKTGSNWNATLADLNLRLYHAAGFTRGTLVVESLSEVDNVELVDHSALTPGDYVLVIENTDTTATRYAIAWHSLPAVTISANVATAREIDLHAGQITVSRTGDTTLALQVPLAVSGTAVENTHFQPLPTTVTIPAGQISATITVNPIADLLAQGNRTVVVAVAEDFALVRDPAQFAEVTIQDKPFDAWRFSKFSGLELGNPAISAETADPDGDQLDNLIEYALARPPKTPDVSPMVVSQSGGYLTLSTAKSTTASDILWAAEVVGDLDDWQPAVPLTDTPTTFVASDFVLVVNAPRRFIRLKITRTLGP